MAVANNRAIIEELRRLLAKAMADKKLFSKEKDVLGMCQDRYRLIWSQIHEYLVPKKEEVAEREIRELIKSVALYDLPTCNAKIKAFSDAIAIYEKRGEEDKAHRCYEYLKDWLDLYDNNYALIAFRSLEHFARYMESDKADGQKVWKYSIDPFNDNGYTGVNFPFFYYFNKMVLDKKVKFISKQYPTGYGKCLIPETEVQTPKGIKTLKDIEVGDYVYSMKDNRLVSRKVLNKWYSKKKQVKITTRGGASVTVSPEHRMYTQRGYIQAQDITQDDYLYRLCKDFENENTQYIDVDELVFVSCMLFEGHCKSNGYGFSQMPDTMIGEDFCRSCDSLGIKYSVHTKQGTKCLNYRLWQNDHIVNGILDKYGLEGKLANEKRLPKQFFNMNLAQKYQFIGIMMATDGYICGNSQCGISLASEELIYDIQKLLNTCGIYSTISKKKSKFNNKEFTAWVLNIPDEYLKNIYLYCNCYDKTPLLMEKYERVRDTAYCNNTNYPKEVLNTCKEFKKYVNKQWSRNKTFKRSIVERFAKENNVLQDVVYKDFVWEQIKSIEFVDEETDMIDIEVEETHNFVANDLVSHNSYSNMVAISWLMGVDSDNDCLIVLGNPTLVLTNTKGIVDMMITERYAKVFPQFQQYHEGEGDLRQSMFSICRQKEGELTIAHSNRAMNVKIISKDTPVDGIRVRYLFLDDVCRSKDAGNMKQHEKDISDYWNSWWKRNYGTDDFYVIVGGTAYSIYDILSSLKSYYSKGKVKKTAVNKYTTESLDGTCAFISIPKLDPDTDESTYPKKFPTEEARAIRKRNLRDFMAMEQQQPLPPETSPFYWSNLQTYDFIPEEKRSEYCWATIDPVRVGGDNFAMPIFVKVGELQYLKDCIYQNKEQEKLYQLVIDKIKQHHITQLVIERNTDTSLKKLLDSMLREQGIGYCTISEIYTYEKKEIRITNQQNNIKTQIVFPAEYIYAISSEMGKFMYDIVSFSWDMSKNQHDDSIDAVTMFCETLLGGKNKQYGTVGTFRR